MTTPAQEAKDFAAANGFTISPLDRRYVVSYPAAQFDTFVANVGGYPAALNTMRKYMDALREAELPVCARDLPVTYTAQQQPINIVPYGDYISLDLECRGGHGNDAIMAKLRADIMSAVKEMSERDDPFSDYWQGHLKRAPMHELMQALSVASGRWIDAIAYSCGAPSRDPFQTDHTYRDYLLHGSQHPSISTFEFIYVEQEPDQQTLDDVSQEQSRRIHGAMGVKKAQPGRFRIDAPEGEYLGFPDRASALKYVRRNLAGVRGVSILPVEQTQ